MCSFCQKYYGKGVYDDQTNTYKDSMLTAEFDGNGEMVCYHCLYTINYNPPDARINFDGAFGLTVYDYIIKCKDYHDKSKCEKDECYLCDFLNGKKIEGIHGSDELYAFSSLLHQTENKPVTEQDDSSMFQISVTI